jgi:hypothetical protein
MRRNTLKALAWSSLCALTLLPLRPALAAQEGGLSPTADAIFAQIETFKLLYSLHLSAAQAISLHDGMQPLVAMAEAQRARENAPEVMVVLADFRQAALAGKPITEAMWARLAQAKTAAGARLGVRDPGDEDPLVALAQKAACDFVVKLQPGQLGVLVSSSSADWASDLLDQAQEQAAASATQWTAWLDGTVEEIMQTQEGLAAGTEAKLRAFFAKVHKLKLEEVLRQRAALTAELTALLTPPLSDTERRKRATERLSEELMNNEHLYGCLNEYARANAE